MSPAAEVREGTATTLSCDVPGREGQDLNYTWYKNSIWLKEGTAHTLLFHHVAASDAGYYSCKVTNDRGSDTSQAITLSVTCEDPRLLPGDGMRGGSPPDKGPFVPGAVQTPSSQNKVSAPNALGPADRGGSALLGRSCYKRNSFWS